MKSAHHLYPRDPYRRRAQLAAEQAAYEASLRQPRPETSESARVPGTPERNSELRPIVTPEGGPRYPIHDELCPPDDPVGAVGRAVSRLPRCKRCDAPFDRVGEFTSCQSCGHDLDA